jgi:hypothetical protein
MDCSKSPVEETLERGEKTLMSARSPRKRTVAFWWMTVCEMNCQEIEESSIHDLHD